MSQARGERAMYRFAIIVAILLSVISPVLLQAQRAGDLQHGARVRVHSVNGRVGVGYIESLSADSLTILDERFGSTTILLDNVSRIEATAGKSHAAGALFGTLKGLVAGAIVGGVGAGVLTRNSAAITIYSIVFAVGGGASGALIGAAQGTERWRTIDRPRYAP